MATEIFLTDGVIRVNVLGAEQVLDRAIDVSAYDQADLVLQIVGVEGTVSSFEVSLIGGMQLETIDGWPVLKTFTSLSSPVANDMKLANVTGLLKYLRWRVTGFSGSGGPSVSFTIRGMARKN